LQYIYIPSFVNIGKAVEAILSSGLTNLTGCKIGIRDGKELQSAPLKLTQAALYTYKVS
jgi:hypothetical protein